jgi:hypothetical protein
MKLLKQGARLAVLAALVASSASVSAIEGLQISVQCPDVILGWPSNPGENYVVQWRPTLSPSTPWVTLTNSLPADWTINWTTFVHSNQVQCSSGGTNSFSDDGGGPPSPPSFAQAATSTPQVSDRWSGGRTALAAPCLSVYTRQGPICPASQFSTRPPASG